MTDTSHQEEMKRYLFHELTPEEGDALEERFFEDTVYFNDLVELENDLIDSYVRGELTGKDFIRFEKSLSKSTELRGKVADARALQTLIAEERPKFQDTAAAASLSERLLSYFNLRINVFKFAGGALAVAIACTGGFLLYKNWQARQEFAEIQKNKEEAERIENENRRKQLEEEKLRLEQELRQNQNNQNSKIEDANDSAPIDNQTIEERKKEIEKLRREIENLPKQRKVPSPNSNTITAPQPYLAVSLFPVGIRGNEDGTSSAELIATGGKQQIKITRSLPADRDYSSYEISSKGKTIKNANIPEGAKSIEFTLEPEVEEFEINVTERNTRGNSETLGKYQLKLTKNK